MSKRGKHEQYPNPLEAQLERALSPFAEFVHNQTTGSVLLILCSLFALVIANSEYATPYQDAIALHAGFLFGNWSFHMTLREWVNDGLMSAFFFVLGLEIKREILVGELRDSQKSLPVIAAALGGMLTPALLFYILNAGSMSVHGWGIPMATDSAFAIGVLALLGRRVPVSLFTFLTALAIIDDLGAITVIAVFYTKTINFGMLSLAMLFLAILASCNVLGCRRPLIYFCGGILVWLGILGSGVHASIAGVLVALIVPARPKRDPQWFVKRTRNLIKKFENIEKQTTGPILGEAQQHEVVERVQDSAEKATTPLRRWERALETPVSLLVMPIFALANAGIPINPDQFTAVWTKNLSLGIILGLLFGKLAGISLMTWLTVRLNLGRLPQDVTLRHIIGIGFLGGMGFTMSIFVAGLGFADSPEALVDAKLSILLATMISGLLGYLWLRLLDSRGKSDPSL